MKAPIFEFAKETVDKIDSVIDETKNREIGGVLCLDANNMIHLESLVEGTEQDIEIPVECKESRSPVGTFHTHPYWEIERISSSDYERATTDVITCIGQKINNKNKIKCLVPLRTKMKKERADLISELSEIEFLINLGYTKEEVEYKIRESGIRDKLDTYFNFMIIE